MPKEAGDPAVDTSRSKTRWQVLPQWRDAHGNHHADPHRWHTDQQAAWSDFHTATREGSPNRLAYTVDLIRSEITRDGNGHWRPEGPPRTIERWPGGTTTTGTRPNLRALAARLRLPADLADPCTGCGHPATSYDPDGQPWCTDHAPRAADT